MPIEIGSTVTKDIPFSIANLFKEVSRRATDATIDKVLKHKLANTADSSAIANTTDETNFDVSENLSESLYKPGRIFKITASGIYSTTGAPNLQFKVLIGSTAILTFTSKATAGGASNLPWIIQAEIVVRTTGTTGTVQGHGRLFIKDSDVENSVGTSAVTVDTTAVQALQISATWGTASASNTTTLKNYILELTDY